MASDSDLWWQKYYQGNTKKHLDHLLEQKSIQNPDKPVEISKRQIYDSFPHELKWNEPLEKTGDAYKGAVLSYFAPPSIYGGQYVPDSVPVTVVPITPVTTVQPQQEHIISLSPNTSKIINDITSGVLVVPDWFYHNIEWVKSGQMTESTFLTGYHDLVSRQIIHEALAEPAPEQTWSGWVTKPSGKVEQITLTISTMQRLIEEGWIFTSDKPPEPEPENQNVSIIFYIGKGGDLKTHFGINSIIITPDEAEKLASWLSQNYNTKILLVTNRLTDGVRTHTLQQIKELIVQKLKDDQPESDDITPDDVKKPIQTGIMGAGIAGAIASLVLFGFIIDHKVGK